MEQIEEFEPESGGFEFGEELLPESWSEAQVRGPASAQDG
jgi:hypothetical protein